MQVYQLPEQVKERPKTWGLLSAWLSEVLLLEELLPPSPPLPGSEEGETLGPGVDDGLGTGEGKELGPGVGVGSADGRWEGIGLEQPATGSTSQGLGSLISSSGLVSLRSGIWLRIWSRKFSSAFTWVGREDKRTNSRGNKNRPKKMPFKKSLKIIFIFFSSRLVLASPRFAGFARTINLIFYKKLKRKVLIFLLRATTIPKSEGKRK